MRGRLGSVAERLREARAGESARRLRDSGEVEERRRQVDVADRRRARAGGDPGPGDDERHADVALEERLVVVPEMARGHPVSRRRDLVRAPLAAHFAAHGSTGSFSRMRRWSSCWRIVRGSSVVFSPWSPVRTIVVSGPAVSKRRASHGSIPASDALVGVAAVAAVLERARVLARRVQVPEVDDAEPRLLALGVGADALEEACAPLAVDGAVGDVAVLGLAEAAGEAGVVEERPGERSPGAPAGAGELLGDCRDVLGELRARAARERRGSSVAAR